MTDYEPEDRSEPTEQPIRARVPEHVAVGAFSTGVIVMTAHSEFILDFVQNLGRPHQIVARVVMPHYVLPQLVDALKRNIELYKGRWGELPQTGQPRISPEAARPTSQSGIQELPPGNPMGAGGQGPLTASPGSENAGSENAGSENAGSGLSEPNSAARVTSGSGPGGGESSQNAESRNTHGGEQDPFRPRSDSGMRQASVQDIYDDLKIRDEILSGTYANAVMIGHGPHEFSFDFITNFYPHSAVSSRVFLAAGQIPRLYESLKGTWEQLKSRMQPPPGRQAPPNDDTSGHYPSM